MSVLILNEAIPSVPFTEDLGFCTLMRYNMRKTMNVMEVYVRGPADIIAAIDAIPNGTLKFLIIRGHGMPYSIALNDDVDAKFKLNLVNVAAIFAALPPKMAPASFIVLESCSTGKFEYKRGQFDREADCVDFNNMAMEFAKLTRLLPDVCVVAPNVPCFVFGVFPSGDGGWKFMNLDAAGIIRDITVCYGAAVKARIDEPRPIDVATDTAPLIHCSSVISRIRILLAPECWNIRQMVMDVVINYRRYDKPMDLVRSLLDFMTPEQMTDGREFDDMKLEMMPFQCSSVLLRCLAGTTLSLRHEISPWFWLPLIIQEWAAERECARYVNAVISAFRVSRLAAELVKS